MLLFLLACYTGPDCASRWDDALAHAADTWPNADAALSAEVGDGCGWMWSHGATSVDGFGATMVLTSARRSLTELLALDIDVYAGGRLAEPSLLFFDQNDGPLDTWPLVGVGYHFDYVPCARPDMPCVPDDALFVHEAGYHHLLFGAGGMTLATDDDRTDGGTVDAAGCEDVDDHDLAERFTSVKHGRAWDLHVWRASDGSGATLARTDPEERWADAPDRVSVDEDAFFTPDDDACGCPQTPPAGDTGDTGQAPPPTCAAPPPPEAKGCGGAALAALLPLGAALGWRRRANRRAGIRTEPHAPEPPVRRVDAERIRARSAPNE